MAGLKQIMEIFMTINQPLSSEQRVRWYIQRIGRRAKVTARRPKFSETRLWYFCGQKKNHPSFY